MLTIIPCGRAAPIRVDASQGDLDSVPDGQPSIVVDASQSDVVPGGQLDASQSDVVPDGQPDVAVMDIDDEGGDTIDDETAAEIDGIVDGIVAMHEADFMVDIRAIVAGWTG